MYVCRSVRYIFISISLVSHSQSANFLLKFSLGPQTGALRVAPQGQNLYLRDSTICSC